MLTSHGRHVIFASDSTNLVPGDSGGRDIFVRDRVANRLTLESLSPTGAQVHNSAYPSISHATSYVIEVGRAWGSAGLGRFDTGARRAPLPAVRRGPAPSTASVRPAWRGSYPIPIPVETRVTQTPLKCTHRRRVQPAARCPRARRRWSREESAPRRVRWRT